MKIKNAFVQLKNRWEVMKDLTFIVLYEAQVILACCTWHNFCKMYKEDTGAFDELLDPKDFNIEEAP